MSKKVLLTLLIIQLFGCATTVNNPITIMRAKTQCPLGYHLEQISGVEICSSNKKSKNSSALEFKCVADISGKSINGSRVD